MEGFVKILLPFALVLSGCGVESMRRLGLKADPASADDVPFDEALVVGCGPTQNAPAQLQADGMQTFGCTLFRKDDRRKAETGLHIFQVNVLLPEGGFEPRPATAELDEANVWHAYFNLKTGRFDQATRVEAKARHGDDEIALRNDGLAVYDPEGLSPRDEQENTFIPRKSADPVIDFQKVDGHILFVTSLAMIPGQDFNSVEGADLRCSIEAQTVASLAIYKFAALLNDATHEMKNRVALVGPIRDVAGEVILEDGPTLFDSGGFGGKLLAIDGTPASDAQKVWTGSAARNCQAWSSKDPAGAATLGEPTGRAWLDAGEGSCAEAARLYCISR